LVTENVPLEIKGKEKREGKLEKIILGKSPKWGKGWGSRTHTKRRRRDTERKKSLRFMR